MILFLTTINMNVSLLSVHELSESNQSSTHLNINQYMNEIWVLIKIDLENSYI